MKTLEKVQLSANQLCTIEDLDIGGSDVIKDCEPFEATIFGIGSPFSKSKAKTVQLVNVKTTQRFRIKTSSMLAAATGGDDIVECIYRNTDAMTVDFDKSVHFIFEANDWSYKVSPATSSWEVPSAYITGSEYDDLSKANRDKHESVDGEDGNTYYKKKA
tara:strand:- start:37 stop:516 length:480 start_codon:yes stop_codon:yes gene_type:complete